MEIFFNERKNLLNLFIHLDSSKFHFFIRILNFDRKSFVLNFGLNPFKMICL